MTAHFFLKRIQNNMASKDFICHFTCVCVCVCVCVLERVAHQNINSSGIEMIFTFLNCLTFYKKTLSFL